MLVHICKTCFQAVMGGGKCALHPNSEVAAVEAPDPIKRGPGRPKRVVDGAEVETAADMAMRKRAEADYAQLQSFGLNTGETFFPPGTKVQNRTAIVRARQDFQELPLAHDALGALADAVGNEDRWDIPATFGGLINPAAVDFVPSTLLAPALLGGYNAGEVHVIPTDRAMQQIMSRKPIGHGAAAADVGSWLSDAERKAVVLRTRQMPAIKAGIGNPSSRELFAMVSPDYKNYDIDEAANDLISVLPADARVRIRYDGQRARVDAVLQNPYFLEGQDSAVVGETHRVVLRMRTADDGSGGYQLAILAERVRCINLTLLHAKRSLFRATHRSEELRTLAKEALANVEPLMKAFSDKWRDSWTDYYVDKATKSRVDGKEALRRIVLNDKYRISGHSAESTLDAVIKAWDEEPGDSKAHVHNALTRAAHTATTSFASRWADDDAEESASQLLYQTVSWLPEVEATA